MTGGRIGARIKRWSVTIAGHRTSFSLEPEFHEALRQLASEQGLSLAELVRRVDAVRDGGLSAALRVQVLRALQDRAAGRPVTPPPPP